MSNAAGATRSAVTAWQVSRGFGQLTDSAVSVAVGLLAVTMFRPTTAAAVIAIGLIAQAISTLPAGAAADRYDSRTALLSWLGAEVSLAAIVGAALVIYQPGGSVLWASIAALVIAFGICNAFSRSVLATLPVQLVAPDQLTSVMGVGQAITRTAGLAGAPLGAVAFVALGRDVPALGWAVLVHAVFVAGCWLGTWRWLHLAYPKTPIRQSMLRGVRSGLGILKDRPPVRKLVIAIFGGNIWLSPVVAIGIALAIQPTGTSTLWVGWSQGLMAGCGVLSVLWCSRFGALRGMWVFIALAAQGVGMMLIGVGVPWALVAGAVMIGLTSGAVSVALQRWLVDVAAKHELGRVFSVVSLCDTALIPVSTMLFGMLTAQASALTACIVFGSIVVVTFSRSAWAYRHGAGVPAADPRATSHS